MNITKGKDKRIEKIEEYKAQQIQPNTYRSNDLKIENMSKKINELVSAVNNLQSK